MTYRNAYKKLNENGMLDKIMSDEFNNGGNMLLIKKDVVDSIDYYVNFTKDSTFKNMKYWQDTQFVRTNEERQHHRICNAICKALAEIEIAEMNKYKEQLEYMIKVQINIQ